MFKNTAGQSWTLLAFATSDHATLSPGARVTGDALNITAKIAKDDGTATATGTTNPTEVEDGKYRMPMTQAESNGDKLEIFPESSTSGVIVVGLPEVVYTRPANLSTLSIDASGRVDLGYVEGTAASTALIQSADLDTADEVATAFFDLADAIETGWTFRETMRIVSATTAGTLSGAGTVTEVMNNLTDAKARVTATVDASGNRTAITYDKS